MKHRNLVIGQVGAGMPGWLSRAILAGLVIVLVLSLGGVRSSTLEASASDEDPPTWSILPEPILRSAIGYPVRQIEARDSDGDGFPELFALIGSQNSSMQSTTLAAYGSSGEDCKGGECTFDEISSRTFEGLSFHSLAGPALQEIRGRGLFSGTLGMPFPGPISFSSQVAAQTGNGLLFVLTRNGRPRERYLHRLVFDGQSGTFDDAPIMDSSAFPSNQLCKLARQGTLGGKQGVYWLAYSDFSNTPCDFWPASGASMNRSRDLYWQEIDDEGMLVPGTKSRLLRGTTARALAIGDFFRDADAAENDPEIFLLEGDAGDERIGIYEVQPEGNSLTGVEVCTLGKLRSERSTHGLVDIALGWLNKDHRPDIVAIKTGGSSGTSGSSQLATWTMTEDWIPGMLKAECGGIFAFEEQAIPEAVNHNSRLALHNGEDVNYVFVNVPTESPSASQTHLHTSPRRVYQTTPDPTVELEPVVDHQGDAVRAAISILVGNLLPGSEVQIRKSTRGVAYCRVSRPLDLPPSQCTSEGPDIVSCNYLDEEASSNQEYTYGVRAGAPAMAPSSFVYARVQTTDIEGECPVDLEPVIATASVWTSQFNGVDQQTVVDSPYVQSGVEFMEAETGRFSYQSAVRFDLSGVAPPSADAVLDDVTLRLKATGVGWTQSWGAPFEIGIWDTDDDSSLWDSPPSATEILLTQNEIVSDTWKLQPYLGSTRTWFQEDHHVAEGKVNRLRFRVRDVPVEQQLRMEFVEAIINGRTESTTLTIVFLRPNATELRDQIRPGMHKWAKWGFELGDPNRGDLYDRMPQLIFTYLTCPR